MSKTSKKTNNKGNPREDSIQRSLSLTQYSLDHAVDIIFWLDPDGNLIYVNKSACKTFGYSKAEFLNLKIFELDASVTETNWIELWEAIKQSGFMSFKTIGIKKDKREFPIEVSANYVKYGNKEYLHAFGRDISEKSEAEEALHKSKEEYRMLFETMALGVVYQDGDGKITSANPAAEAILGLPLSKLKNRTSEDSRWQAIHEDGSPFPGKDHPSMVALRTGEPVKNVIMGVNNEKLAGNRWILINALPQFKAGAKQPYQAYTTLSDITDRLETEKALRESKESFKNLAERSPNMIFINQNGRIVYVNKKCVDTMGYTREEYYSPDFNFLDLISEDLKEMVISNFKKHMNGENVEPYDYSIVTKDGKKIDAIINTKLITHQGHDAILGIITDITERKRTEESLSRSEEAYRELFDLSVDGVLILSEGKVVQANKAICDLHQMTQQELLGMNPMDLVYEEDKSIALKGLEGLYEGKADVDYNIFRALRSDGSYFWSEVKSILIEWQGQPAIKGIIRDITERKKAEEILLESEERFRSLVETSSGWVWEIDKNGRYIYSSPKVQDLLGYEPEEVIGKTPFDLMPSDEAKKIGAIFSDIVNSQKSFDGIENINLHKNGKKLVLETSGAPIYNTEGNFIGYRGIDRDISERKHMDEEVQKLAEAVRHSGELVNLATLDGNMIFLNEAGCKMLGIEPDEVKSTNIMQVIPDHLNDIVVNEVVSALLQGNTWKGELQYRNIKTGELIDVYADTFAILDHSTGRPLYLANVSRDITESKVAQEALRESEEKYRMLYESATDAIFLMKFDKFLECNPTTLKMFKCAREQIIGQSPLKFSPEKQADGTDSAEKIQSLVAKVLKGEPQFFEWNHRRMDGSILDAEVSLNMIGEDHQGYLLAIVRDITERKLVEKALQDSEEKFRNIIEASPMGMHFYQLKPGGHLVFMGANPAADKILGVNNDQFIGKTIEDAFPRLAETEVPERYKLTASKGIPWQTEQIIYDDKKIGGAFLVNAFQTSPDMMAASFLDITESKKAQEALKASEERYHNLFNSVMEGIGATDEKDEIVFFNPAASQIFADDPKADIKGRKIIDYIPENHKEIYLAEHEKRVKGESSQYELEIRSAKGYKKILLLSELPRLDESKNYIGALAAFIDITETKRLQEFAARAQRLEAAGRIAGQVAHDFNNLLAPIMAYPEFIRETLPENHSAFKYINDIEMAAEQIAEINQQLLTLGRRGYYSLEPLDLNHIIGQIINHVQPIPDTLTIDIDLEKNLMMIKGGGSQIFRALLNLMVNARDATRDNGQIKLKTENYYVDRLSGQFGSVQRGEYVKLTISDNGSGIPPEIMPKILDPFFTTKVPGEKRGSGLGLSVVHAVIEDHNGYLDLKSEVGAGTSFYIFFPTTREKAESIDQEFVSGGNEKLLIVDDDEIQREVMTNLLKGIGYQTSAVESGEKAVEFVMNNPQDLLILDMIMPGGMDGKATYENVLNIYPNQKAIIVSGFAESSRVKQLMEMGAGSFLKKPITFKGLSLAVRRELDRVAVKQSSK
ncbi:MAG: PAS domain S-box protein [candidate division Zixibacteria bacterium]|nr:PAS domain S-box protein [candidate division Zixibacteria bacterium]